MSRVRIAHLSDPHFGTVYPDVQKALVTALHDVKPDLILVSGDITQRARRTQFLAAREFLRSLAPIATFAVPGNHDIPLFNIFGRMVAPYRGFHRYFQPSREKSLRVGNVRVVGLNSTSRWRHVQGSLSLPRIRPRLFDDWATAKVRIVAVHHPLDCAQRVDDKNLMRGREEVFALFEDAQIDIVLGGHVHDPFVTLSNARYPASKRSMILSVAGTCLSWRIRKDAPNSFHLLEVESESDPRVTITRVDFDGRAFRPRADEVKTFQRQQDAGWRPVKS